MMQRRGFLKIMSGAVASAPTLPSALRAKAQLDADIGIKAMAGNNARPIAGAGVSALSGPSDWVTRQLEWFARHKTVPRHIDVQMRREARRVEVLDPDLAAKRSWSMSVKIQEQRKRNYEERLKAMVDGWDYDTEASAFEKATGWRWYL